MSILDELSKEEVWKDFLNEKTKRGQFSKKETTELCLFIEEKRFLKPLIPSIPEKKILSKIGTDKKRTVYCFDEDTTWRLKLLAYLLYRYDDKLADSCYSFRRKITAKTAFERIRRIKDIDNKYVLKADIHDYFNSIPVERLLDVLKENIDDDPMLLKFFEGLLTERRCLYEGKIIEEDKGAMAGVPLASFFANFYLKDMDLFFEERGIDYFRYSDDILLFSDNEEELHESFHLLKRSIESKGLTLNERKLSFSSPKEHFEFLGFDYCQGVIDLSEVTVRKMKGKISRKARSLYRKRIRRNDPFEKTAMTMIRCFDGKFYDLSGENDYTWTRFYFPVLNSSSGLKKIDRYMTENLRYLYSGRHYKGNYKITYEQLKRLGYTPLVHEYYTWKKENRLLRDSGSRS